MNRFFPSVFLVAAISLLLSVIWPSSSSAAMPTFTSLGQLRAQGLEVPGAMALDAAGNLYVADAQGGEVFSFDRYGRLKAVFDAQVSGRGLAVSPDGSKLYVARKHKVVVLDAVSGTHLLDLTNDTFGLVGEIELDDAGNVYVADVGVNNQTIKILSPAGQPKASFGGAGTAAGQFRQIGCMAFTPAGQLLVVDQSAVNNKVQVFTVDPVTFAATVSASYLTTSLANFGAPGVVAPRGVDFDSQGRGYFLDFLNSQLRIVSPGMTYLGSYGQTGFAVGQLAYVTDVAVENTIDSQSGKANTRVFVSCDAGRIEVFGVDGGVSPVFVNHAPSVPVPQGPVAGSEVTVAAPSLQFAAASDEDGDALTYQITIYQGDTVVSQITTALTSVNLPSGLLTENAGCSWTVEAFDAEGAGSGASAPATFVVNAVNEPPSAPVLVTPVKGETLAGAGLLSWQASNDPDPNDTLLGYRVEVSADVAFTAPVLTTQVAGLDVALADFAAYAELADGGAYFWRASAVDSDGLVSVPGASGQFVYDTALLKVAANVPGASVYLGGNHGYAGRFVGIAPVEVRDLTEGALSVVVERVGFEPYVTQVAMFGAENVSVSAVLSPARQPAGLQLVGNGINGRTGLDVGDAAVPFLVDFDNDGDLDLLAGGANGNVTLFPSMQLTSRGQLTFQAGTSLRLPVMPGAVPFVADWNNDGRKDLLVGQADGSVKLFLNTALEAAPAFGAGQDLAVAGSVLNVGAKAAPAVIDLDGDGAKDLVVGNAAGQVMAFYNAGDDVAPQLAAPVLLFQTAGAAVPFPVDLDADGQRDLLVAVNGQAVPYRNDLTATGTFVAGAALAGGGFNAVFPLDINSGKGKDLIVGQADGKLAYWAGNANVLTAAALAALMEKVDEVAGLLAAEAPELLPQIDKIRQQIISGSLAGAVKTAQDLAGKLPAGEARAAVLELAALCR